MNIFNLNTYKNFILKMAKWIQKVVNCFVHANLTIYIIICQQSKSNEHKTLITDHRVSSINTDSHNIYTKTFTMKLAVTAISRLLTSKI